MVEVDSSYYFPPSERNAALWAERTPKEFTFNIKAYSLLTEHPTKVESLYKEIREGLPKELLEKKNVYRDKLPDEAVEEVKRFREALMPCTRRGSSAAAVPVPPVVRDHRKSKDYLLECKERLPTT